MKSIIFFSLFVFAFSQWTTAQYYNFKVEQRAYKSQEQPDYENSTDTSGGLVIRAYGPFSIESYYAFGQPLDSGFSIGTNGFALSQNSKNSFTFDPFVLDLYLNQKTSKISYREYLENEDSVFEIEWYHMGIIGHKELDFLDFQVRFFKKTRTIEYHYGPSEINTPNAFTENRPIINMSYLSLDFMSVKEQYFFSGDPQSPIWNQWPQFDYAKRFPKEGTVYRFEDKIAMGINSDPKKRSSPLSLQIRYAPEHVIVLAAQQIANYRVMDVGGRVLSQRIVRSNQFRLKRSLYDRGILLIEAELENGETVRRTLINY